jgi:hypothetical protein
MRRSWSVLWLTAALLGCGSSGDSSPDGDDDEQEETADPILERESAGTYQCSVKQTLVNYMPRAWMFGSAALAGNAQAALLARLETQTGELGIPGEYELVVSSLDATGALGESAVIPVEDPWMVSSPALLPLDATRTALVWVEGAALHYTTLDAQGKAAEAATILSGDVDSLSRPRLALGAQGTLGLAFRGAAGAARFVEIDDAGKLVQPAIELGEGKVDAAPELVSLANGFALLWSAMGEPDSNGYYPTPEVFFARVEDGKVQGDVEQVSRAKATNEFLTGSFFSPSQVSLVRNGEGFLGAWSAGSYGSAEGENPSDGYSVIRLARLDAQGKVVGKSVQLDRVMDSVDDVEPQLVPFGDALALLWARGSHIYICGGCIPDHDLHAVLIDPESLTPLSNVVKVGAEHGGLLRRQTLVQESDLLAAFEIMFHTNSYPAFAAFHCE